ncbi:MAG: tRNA (adenosine(37)-N6)-dimethylallyltransferase MiaA [Deltaproteobacteria bacterium]|nr:tRNA (adenosine(37)-N6)-dimethylallyltransferase MiaA [Deltaproteobacteria bacterium]
MKPKIIILYGSTGIGKTHTAITLARMFNGEIIGADSMQVYRRMDIGTAKPTVEEQAGISHHMIDVAEPDEPFDAARYSVMARKITAKLCRRKVIPFVVGGTGLYIQALIHGIFPSLPSDPAVRASLKEEAGTCGSAFLHRRLHTCDPEAARRIHPNDAFRIIRALEVYQLTGRPLSVQQAEHGFAEQPFTVLKTGLHLDRKILYERINHRVDAMIRQGLVEEVRNLLAAGYGAELKSMQSIGYRHMVDYLENRLAWDEAVRTLKRDTRRYAKRQMTWLRGDTEIHWFEPGRINSMQQQITAFLNADR